MTPYIICHIMSSVDGRLLPSRWTKPYGDTPASALLGEYSAIGKELDTDAWMFGKSTAGEFFPERFESRSETKAHAGKVHKAPRKSSRLFITADLEADIRYTSSSLRGDDILVILGTDAGADYLRHLEDAGISYIVTDDCTDMRKAMEVVAREFGVKRISLQGGGIIDGAMLSQSLIDELSLVIYPGIDGLAAAPSIFECQGSRDSLPADGQTLELTGSETRAGGVVWLRYRIRHKR